MSFPMCEKMGLKVELMWPVNTVSHGANLGYSVVSAADLEKLLSEGVALHSYGSKAEWYTDFNRDFCKRQENAVSALAINIQPIEKDTAEGLLKELLAECPSNIDIKWQSWFERAKKLTGG